MAGDNFKKGLRVLGSLGNAFLASKKPQADAGFGQNSKYSFNRKNIPQKPKKESIFDMVFGSGQAQRQNSQINKGAFETKTSLNRVEMDRYLKKVVTSKEMIPKFIRYFPKKPGESDVQRIKRIETELFGGVREAASPGKAGPIGAYISPSSEDKYKISERIKLLQKGIRMERNPRQKEMKKVELEILYRSLPENFRGPGGQKKPVSEISGTEPTDKIDKDYFSRN